MARNEPADRRPERVEQDGSRYHDEIANTDPDHLGASEKAKVHDNSPQGYGWTAKSLTDGVDGGAKRAPRNRPDYETEAAGALTRAQQAAGMKASEPVTPTASANEDTPAKKATPPRKST